MPPATVTTLRGRSLWVNPNTLAAEQRRTFLAKASTPGLPADEVLYLREASAIMGQLAEVPTALWVGDWTPWDGDTTGAIRRILQSAGDKVVQFCVYNCPNRDLGSHSAGGLDAQAYPGWIRKIAAGIDRFCIVYLEPDAIPMADRMSVAAREERYALLRDAGKVLTDAGAWVYFDAGGSNWVPVDSLVPRLKACGVEQVRGFCLNIAHFQNEGAERRYAAGIRLALPRAFYAIDTRGAGQGPPDDQAGVHPDRAWLNPLERVGLGERPLVVPGGVGYDLRTWAKGPVSSDGSLEPGEPPAGAAHPAHAIRMWNRALPAFPPLVLPVVAATSRVRTGAMVAEFVDPPARYS
jgi:endoglucanase